MGAGILEYAIFHTKSTRPCQAKSFHMTFPELFANCIRRGRLSPSLVSEDTYGSENRCNKEVVFTSKLAASLLESQQGYYYASTILQDNLYHTFFFQTMVPLEDDASNKSKSWERVNVEDRVELNRLWNSFQS